MIGENVAPTRHPLISSANEDCLSWDELISYIKQFEGTIDSHDVDRSRALLVEAVKGFAPQCDVADLVQLKQDTRTADATNEDNVLPNHV